jgi:amidase
MNLAEYASYDALGLADLVAKKQVSPKELALTAVAAKEKVDPTLKSVVELYPDRIDGLDEKSLGSGPFRGVPFLIKDVFGHEKGRKIEFGSRLCAGMTVETGTYFADMLKASGVNILGRSAAPECGDDRERHVRQYVEPLEAGLLRRWIQWRRPGRGAGGHRADRTRLRYRRLDPYSRQLVRRRRPQAVAHAGLGRPDRR